MRIFLAAVFSTALAISGAAAGFLKREPHVLAPGATVYVDNGHCGSGKVLKIVAAYKGSSRKKTCVAADPREQD